MHCLQQKNQPDATVLAENVINWLTRPKNIKIFFQTFQISRKWQIWGASKIEIGSEIDPIFRTNVDQTDIENQTKQGNETKHASDRHGSRGDDFGRTEIKG